MEGRGRHSLALAVSPVLVAGLGLLCWGVFADCSKGCKEYTGFIASIGGCYQLSSTYGINCWSPSPTGGTSTATGGWNARRTCCGLDECPYTLETRTLGSITGPYGQWNAIYQYECDSCD